MKLNVIEKFTGSPGENIEQWLDKALVAISILYEIEDDAAAKNKLAKCMPLLIDGAAYTTWKQLPEDEKSDYEKISKSLKKVYVKSKTAAWEELKNLKLIPGEPVDVLGDKINTLLRIVSDDCEIPSQIAAMFVVDALPCRIAEQIRILHGEKMDLKGVVNAAKTMMAEAQRSDGVYGAAGFTKGFRGDSRRQATYAGSGGSTRQVDDRRSFEERTRESPDRKSIIKCYCCGRVGHMRQDCRVRCYSCGKCGHKRDECERKTTPAVHLNAEEGTHVPKSG